MKISRAQLAANAQKMEKSAATPSRPLRLVQTPFGIGRLGPYRDNVASTLLSGKKPVGEFSEKYLPQELLNLLMIGMKKGFLTYKKIWENNSGHLFGHTYYFSQPERSEDINELIAMTKEAEKRNCLYAYPNENLGGVIGYTIWDEIRMGEIFGYTKADIAAFLEHVGYSSEIYLDPARRVEAEREQASRKSTPYQLPAKRAYPAPKP